MVEVGPWPQYIVPFDQVMLSFTNKPLDRSLRFYVSGSSGRAESAPGLVGETETAMLTDMGLLIDGTLDGIESEGSSTTKLNDGPAGQRREVRT